MLNQELARGASLSDPVAPQRCLGMGMKQMLMLAGLTIEESEEFARLDDSVPFDGAPVWPTMDMPQKQREQRWLELWNRHAAATGGPRRVQEIARN